MIVVCVMVTGQENSHNGRAQDAGTSSQPPYPVTGQILYTGFLPVDGNSCISGCFRDCRIHRCRYFRHHGSPALSYLLKWCAGLFLTMLPSLAVMWMLTVLFEKTLFSVGLNSLLVIPGLLAGASPVWFLYPYCYSGYFISRSLQAFTTEVTADTTYSYSFPYSLRRSLIFTLALFLSASRFFKQT